MSVITLLALGILMIVVSFLAMFCIFKRIYDLYSRACPSSPSVRSCPCPVSVRNPKNEDSEAETGLKSQEDSDSVEAKSE